MADPLRWITRRRRRKVTVETAERALRALDRMQRANPGTLVVVVYSDEERERYQRRHAQSKSQLPMLLVPFEELARG